MFTNFPTLKPHFKNLEKVSIDLKNLPKFDK